MELKRKTLIWETNNEPPKNYIWIKDDGKAYEFNGATKKWEESKELKALCGDCENNEEVGELNMKEIIKNALISLGAGEQVPDLIYPDSFLFPPRTVCKTAEDLVIGIFNKTAIPIYKDIPGNVALETPVSSEDLGEGTYLFWSPDGDYVDFTQSGEMYQVVPIGTEEEYYSLQIYDVGGGGGGGIM